MPRTASAKNQRPAYGRATPTARSRPGARPVPSGEAAYPSSSAARSTRSRVPRETLGRPRRARDTVATETPARRATSTMPARSTCPAGPACTAPAPFGAGPDVPSDPSTGRQTTLGNVPDFTYADLLPRGEDDTRYRLVSTEGVRTLEAGGRTFLEVSPEALRLLTETAMHDIAHYLRPAHLAQLRRIVDDPQASPNDRYVALDLLKNANVAAGGVLPMCQDTGTAIVMGKRGSQVLSTGATSDEEALSRGVFDAYTRLNLRYSQLAPLTMWDEKNTGSNLPAQVQVYADTKPGHESRYEFLFMAKGGGSANKSFLYQETKAVLNPASMLRFLDEKLRSLGTAACPPYHLAIVVGGTSAEYALKTAKYASAHYLDTLPTSGSAAGHGFRDLDLELEVLELTRQFGIGAQFGGKYFCHDVRVVRLPRHGASCPVAIAVSCSADRQALGRISAEGVFLEQLETDPAQYLPETMSDHLDDSVVRIGLARPVEQIRSELSKYPGKSGLSLRFPRVVARNSSHGTIKEGLSARERR